MSNNFYYYDINIHARIDSIPLYGFAIPNDEALEVIKKYSPIIEIGAGAGYWAYCLNQLGVAVEAFDNCSWGTKWVKLWFGVKSGNEITISSYPQHTLFLCWPNHKDPMAFNCLKKYQGKYFIYVGEAEGGCTGDDAFHELLSSEWMIVEEVRIPQWFGIHDRLWVYERKI